MKTLPFKKSELGTIGVELEYQIINPKSFELTSRSKDLIRSVSESQYSTRIKPEITQSMVEVNTSVHHSVTDMLEELYELQDFLLAQGKELKVAFCGGGMHPFQKWSLQKIFPDKRYRRLSFKFRYLSKQATVFGQHIHVGCPSGEDALYLTHALSRYAPHLIAICASSPFYQAQDTGFHSSRASVFSSFPLSGVIPYLRDWQEFSSYFFKMKSLGIISTMKDFYWDIRPKPEFGTVEIRVTDTPLTMQRAVQIVAYVQALSLYLLEERPIQVTPDLYYLYPYNRFQASRYAYDGTLIDFNTSKKIIILDDILETIKKIEVYANHLGNMGYISQLMEQIINKHNDTVLLRNTFKQLQSYQKIVEKQCEWWAEKGSV